MTNFFRILRLSQLSYQLRNYPSILCEMIHHCKDIFKLIPYKVWKKNYVNLVYFSWIIRFIRFYFYIFLGSEKKEDFIKFFIFLWNLLFVFENHLRVRSFLKSSVLFICYSFMILSQIKRKIIDKVNKKLALLYKLTFVILHIHESNRK